jgi:indolepyruvate ferredoxin oxidoreductase
MACTPCGTARARAWTARATRSSTATPTARRRMAACWWWRATTTAACPRRCRTRATRPHGLAHAGAAAGQRGRIPGVRPVRLGAVALLGRLGRHGGAVRNRGERGHRGPRRGECARRRLGRRRRRARRHRPSAAPPDGLHYRWPDLPSLRIESRLEDKLAAVAAFTRRNSIDRHVISEPARQGRHRHLRQGAPRPDGGAAPPRTLAPEQLARAGVRLYKVGLSFPLEQTRLKAFAQGLERDPRRSKRRARWSRPSCATSATTRPADARPVLVGKHDRAGQPLVSALGELRPSRLIDLVAHWLAVHFPDNHDLGDHLQHVRDFTPPDLLGNAQRQRSSACRTSAPAARTTPAPRCPRARPRAPASAATSWPTGWTAARPASSRWAARASTGSRTPCSPRRRTCSRTWATAPTTTRATLAIRQAVAAKATLTYKILFNDAVAMTGGQPVDGVISVDAIARQVESEGVAKVVVVSDAIGHYDAIKNRFPARHRVPRPRRTRRGAAPPARDAAA